MDWYRWPNQADAQAALDSVNDSPLLPHVGRNAATGKPMPHKTQTTKWCESITEFIDGKWGFPRITTAWLDEINLPQDERDNWVAFYLTSKGGTIDEFDPAWFPEPEDEG